MSKIQLVFFDIDDTLYRKATETVPQSALNAIRKLRENGIHAGIATGRSLCAIPPAIQPLFDDGTLDILVSINGQYCCQFENGKPQLLAHHPMDVHYIRAVITYLRQKGWEYAGVSEDTMASSTENDIVKQSLKGIGEASTDPDYALNHTIYQMLLFLDDSQLSQFEADGMIWDGFEVLRWHPNAVDLVQKNGAKGFGIRAVCDKLGIPIKNTMAFGDGHNDLEMMKTVGIGIAMGDALPSIKSAATYITGTIEQDGIANALKHYGLIA